MEFIQIEVAQREALGTANANRLRRAGQVPAVLYGMKRKNLDLAIERTEMERFLRTGSHLVELRLGDETRPAILRDMQIDALTDTILHVDFNRVDHDAELETEVPIEFKGRAKGEGEGGVFTTLVNFVAVRARPGDLPRQYVVDISEIGLNESVTVADLEARKGVTLTQDPTTVLGQCAEPKVVAEEPAEGEAVEGEAAEGEAPAAEGGAEGDAPASEGGE